MRYTLSPDICVFLLTRNICGWIGLRENIMLFMDRLNISFVLLTLSKFPHFEASSSATALFLRLFSFIPVGCSCIKITLYYRVSLEYHQVIGFTFLRLLAFELQVDCSLHFNFSKNPCPQKDKPSGPYLEQIFP